MRKLLLAVLVLNAINHLNVSAQSSSQIAGKRTYSLAVLEMNQEERASFDTTFAQQELQNKGGRGAFISALWAANRSALLNTATTTVEEVVDVAVNRLSDKMRNPRSKWEEAVKKECFFTQQIWMKDEVKDFYSNISTKGPFDPSGIIFNGFSCNEVVMINDTTKRDVFFVSCKLAQDTLKIKRMLAHSKFEVYVDSVYFNPYICDIPNDSLQDVSKRIAFDFNTREDLHLKIHAEVTSSWINQATMIFNNQKLGEFDIDIKIDPMDLDSCSVFKYSARNINSPINAIKVSGESFVVPRSYSGSEEENGIWGTGQYKVNMVITESCRIKKDYYMKQLQPAPGQTMKKGKQPEWNDNWKPEWELIRSRPAKTSFWQEAWTVVKTQWTGKEWLTEITSPTTSYLIKEGSTYVNGGVVLTKYNKTGAGMQGTSGTGYGSGTGPDTQNGGGQNPPANMGQ